MKPSLLLLILMQALFALTFPVGKLVLQYAGPLFLVGFRMTLAGSLLLGYYFSTVPTSERKKITKSDWSLLFQIAFFGIYLSFVGEFWALESMSSIKSNMLWSSSPFISALLSYYYCGERLTRNKWAGLVIGLLGMLPVIFLVSPQEMQMGEFMHVSLPDLVMTGAVIASAYGFFLLQQVLHRGHTVVFANGITMLVGGVLAFLTRYAFFSHEQAYSEFIPMFLYVALLITVSNIVGFAIYGYLLRSFSATFMGFAGFLCPLFGAFFSYMLLGEHIYCQHLIAFCMVMLGLWIFYKDELLA